MSNATESRTRRRVREVTAALDRRLLAVAGLLLVLGIVWAGFQVVGGQDAGDGAGTFSVRNALDGFREQSAADAPAPGLAPAPSGESEFAARGPAFDADESSGAGGLPQLNLGGRTIIRSGSLDLLVEEVDTTYHRVQQIAAGAGGFVADSTFTGSEERQRATVTIRVPSDRFQSVIDELRELAVEVRSISTSAQDVTEEYTDLQASLRNLRAVEAQYIELLGRANEIRDVLQVQEHLNSVRMQIERVQGRIQMLDQLSEMGTLTVSLRPADTPVVTVGGGIGEAVRDAWAASLRSIEAVATVAVVAIVYSWWLLPLIAVLYLLGRRWLRTPRPVAESAAEGTGGGA